jgi:Flp pilus assembly protein TadD
MVVFISACTPAVDPYHQRISKLTVLEKDQDDSFKTRIANLPPEELTEKGNTYLSQGNMELARLHFSAALQKNPKAIAPLAGMGQVFFARGSTSRAREIFNTVLEQDPQNMVAQLGLARIARNQGDYPTAETLMESLYAGHPDNPVIISELAITYDSIGQDKLVKAEPLHQKFLALQPDQQTGFNNLGFNYLLQGRYSEAIPFFSKALAIDPANMRTKNNLATAFLLNNEEVRALQLFENTLGKPAAYNNIGYLYMTQGSWDKAEKAFRKALELNPVFYMRAQQNLERLNSLRTQSRD